MARKQKASLFNKFLDMIGIVDTNEDDQQGNGYDDDFDTRRVNNSRNSSKNVRFNDEFENEPRMSRAQSRRSGTSSADSVKNSGADRFDADEGWGDDSGRPEYGARNQQRAQSKTRTSSSRYANTQRNTENSGSRSNSRYENAGGSDDYYKNGSSYQDYQQGSSYRSSSAYGSSYGSYGSNTHRYESDSVYNYASDHKEVDNSMNQQRHQTVIFKLHSVDECKGVILALIEKKSVLLNLDELDSLQAQRTLDTMSGATFAIGARLSRASDRTWLITPNTVEVNDNPTENTSSANSYTGRYY